MALLLYSYFQALNGSMSHIFLDEVRLDLRKDSRMFPEQVILELLVDTLGADSGPHDH